MAKFIDLTGQRFGRWTVLERAPNNAQSQTMWVCQCDCGNIGTILASSLRSGGSLSCGCTGRVIDLTGQRFGNLVVLERAENRDYTGNAFWLCQCDCGNTSEVQANKLRSGHTKTCGCTAPKLKDITGQRFGRWTIIDKAGNAKHGEALWNCVCDCGNTGVVGGGQLRTGHSQSCGCLQQDWAIRHETEHDSMAHQAFRVYKKGAKSRGLSFNLTFDQWYELSQQPCYLCGRERTNTVNGDKVRRKSAQGMTFQYNGIDRVDNSRGYEIDNVQPCCFDCNRIKRNRPLEDVIEHIKRIAARYS